MRIEFGHAAEKALGDLAADRRRLILDRLRRLAADPRDPMLDIAPLQGRSGVFRLRVGGFRVLYRIDPAADRILIEMIRSRGDVYKR